MEMGMLMLEWLLFLGLVKDASVKTHIAKPSENDQENLMMRGSGSEQSFPRIFHVTCGIDVTCSASICRPNQQDLGSTSLV